MSPAQEAALARLDASRETFFHKYPNQWIAVNANGTVRVAERFDLLARQPGVDPESFGAPGADVHYASTRRPSGSHRTRLALGPRLRIRSDRQRSGLCRAIGAFRARRRHCAAIQADDDVERRRRQRPGGAHARYRPRIPGFPHQGRCDVRLLEQRRPAVRPLGDSCATGSRHGSEGLALEPITKP